MGPAAWTDLREELPAHLRAPRWDSTGRRWWRNTGCSYERPSERDQSRSSPVRGKSAFAQRSERGGRSFEGLPGRSWECVCVVIVLLIVGLLLRRRQVGKSTAGTSAQTDDDAKHQATHGSGAHRASGTATGATSSCRALTASDRDRVHLLDRRKRQARLIDGQTLEAGPRTPTFHAKRFELTLGNNAVARSMIDGTPRDGPRGSSGAIGYTITKGAAAARWTPTPRSQEGNLPT